MEKIKDFLVPEKVVEEKVEGQKENTKVSLNESEAGYTVYFDKERYSMEKVDGKDRIVPKATGAEDLPEVYLEISQAKDKSPEEMATRIEGQLKGTYGTVNDIGNVEEPLKAHVITASAGNEWNDVFIVYYLVDNGQGGSFVIQKHLFNEAAEGHGARFDNMLKEFRITPADSQ